MRNLRCRSDRDGCDSCGVGKYAVSGALACKMCDAGRYPKPDRDGCDSRGAGKDAVAGDLSCKSCDAGPILQVVRCRQVSETGPRRMRLWWCWQVCDRWGSILQDVRCGQASKTRLRRMSCGAGKYAVSGAHTSFLCRVTLIKMRIG